MSPSQEKHLIGQALAGNQEAFSALYQAHHTRVYAAVMRFATNHDEAEDLTQVTFIKAFQGLANFRGEAAFTSWLAQIALNVCRSHLRSERTRRRWLARGNHSSGKRPNNWAPANQEDPDQLVQRKECWDLINQGIAALPDQYQQVLWLRYVKDRSYHEITQTLRVPMGTVKAWLHRGRQQLRDEFQRLGISVV